MYCELYRKQWVYFDDELGYRFKLKDPSIHNQETTLVKLSQIQVLKNESDMETKALKEFVLKEWFVGENDEIRDKKNAKVRDRRAAASIKTKTKTKSETPKSNPGFRDIFAGVPS